MWSANNQLFDVTNALAGAAKHPHLKSFLENSSNRVRNHNGTLAEIVRAHNADPGGEHCKGMEGLITEARSHALDSEITDADVRDAAIITQYQRMTHYGLAGYGTARAMARRLGFSDDEQKIGADLEEIYTGDRLLTSLAEGEVNPDATW
jgi:ferritin-like metal-binding protein YciE